LKTILENQFQHNTLFGADLFNKKTVDVKI